MKGLCSAHCTIDLHSFLIPTGLVWACWTMCSVFFLAMGARSLCSAHCPRLVALGCLAAAAAAAAGELSDLSSGQSYHDTARSTIVASIDFYIFHSDVGFMLGRHPGIMLSRLLGAAGACTTHPPHFVQTRQAIHKAAQTMPNALAPPLSTPSDHPLNGDDLCTPHQTLKLFHCLMRLRRAHPLQLMRGR